MKKSTSVLLSFFLIFSFIAPVLAESVPPPISDSSSMPMDFSSFSKTDGFHFDFQPSSPIWKDMIAGQAPARLNATYTLRDNVVKVDADFDQNIKPASQLMNGSSIAHTPAMRIVSNGAFISKPLLDSVAGVSEMIQPDTVFVNENTGTAFKVVAAMDGDEDYEKLKDHYAVTKPQVHEVVDDFMIPSSDVALNKANITSFAGLPNSTASSVENYIVKSASILPLSSKASPMAVSSIKDPLIQFAFPEGTELQATSGGQNITVKVSGGLAVGNLGLEAKYSGFDGYYFALKIAEEAYLNVDVGISTNQEIRIPILGIDVPFGIGRVSGGLFVIVALDGEVTIQMEAREYISSKMGVKGDTFLYAPVSCKPFFSLPEKSFDGDVQVDGQINGYVKAGALLSMEIFGWDLVGAGVFIGSGVNITSLDGLLDIELYGLIQVYVTFAGDTYYLINYKPTLLRKQQKDMGGYRVTLEEACAYQDIVVGYLQKSVTQGGQVVLEKAGNTMFDIVVVSPITGTKTIYPTNNKFYYTDPDGRFLIRDYPDMDLQVKDQVSIQVYEQYDQNGTQKMNVFGPSKPVSATYPFRNIRITAADAFNDWIEGQVEPARVRNWNKQPGEDDYKMLIFNGDVRIDIQSTNKYNNIREKLYTVHVTTDENGFFRAINGSLKPGDPVLDFKNDHRFTASIDQDNALVTAISYVSPYTHFVIKSVSEKVPGSSVRFMEGSDTIDQVRIKTRLYVINMGGSRQLTNVPASVTLFGLSTQDRGTNGYWAWNPTGDMQWYSTGDSKTVNNVKRELVLKSSPSIPIEDSANIGLINDQTNGTSYVDLTVVKEWVWPEHSNPTVITSPDHTEITTDGGTFQVTATGDAPIRISATPAIPGVTLAPNGLMSMASGMTPGIYKMTIKAAAKTGDSLIVNPGTILPGTKYVYTEDAYPPVYQDFTLTVLAVIEPTPEPTGTPTVTPTSTSTPTVSPSPTLKPTATPKPAATPTSKPTPTLKPSPTPSPSPSVTPSPSPTPTATPTPTVTPIPIPPTITSARTATIYRPGGGTFQVIAIGTLPITYSLAPLPDLPDSPVPDGVSIDPVNGLITVEGWVAAGTYYFNIIATNPYGQDQQTFMLLVKNLLIPKLQENTISSDTHLTPISSRSNTDQYGPIPLSAVHSGAGSWIANLADASEYVLRNDDPKDLYSQDMLYISGAEYVKYDLMIDFMADGDRYIVYDYDNSPCNNHHATPMSDSEKQAIEDYFKNRLLFIEYDRFSFGPDIESRMDVNILDDLMDVSVFDYGSMIDAINELDEGNLSVSLGGETGTIVPGNVFNALKDRSGQDIGLTFGQEGAAMTFMSGTIGTVETGQSFDFAFSTLAVNETAMKSAAGPGASSFTFAFAHNDTLPGYAQFDIVTDLTAGQIVNVYKYNGKSQKFSAIAARVTVADGGVVTYMNNTMSEYLITTATLQNAVMTDAIQINNQDSEKRPSIWPYFAGGGLLLMLMVIAYILVRRKKKKNRAV